MILQIPVYNRNIGHSCDYLNVSAIWANLRYGIGICNGMGSGLTWNRLESTCIMGGYRLVLNTWNGLSKKCPSISYVSP